MLTGQKYEKIGGKKTFDWPENIEGDHFLQERLSGTIQSNSWMCCKLTRNIGSKRKWLEPRNITYLTCGFVDYMQFFLLANFKQIYLNIMKDLAQTNRN